VTGPYGVRVAAQELLDRIRGLALETTEEEAERAHALLLKLDGQMQHLQMHLDNAPMPIGAWGTEPADAAARLRGAELAPGAGARSLSVQEEIAYLGGTLKRPTYAQVAIEYEPARALLYQEGLALYLWSWRDIATTPDALAEAIASDVAQAIGCRSVKVIITQRASVLSGALAMQAYVAR